MQMVNILFEGTREPMTGVERRLARLDGVATILIGAAGLSMVPANWQTRLHGGRDISAIAPLAMGFVVLGFGSLLGLRAALYLIAGVSAVVGTWLAYGSVREVSFPWVLLNLGLAALLTLPAVLLARLYWLSNREKLGGTQRRRNNDEQ